MDRFRRGGSARNGRRRGCRMNCRQGGNAMDHAVAHEDRHARKEQRTRDDRLRTGQPRASRSRCDPGSSAAQRLSWRMSDGARLSAIHPTIDGRGPSRPRTGSRRPASSSFCPLPCLELLGHLRRNTAVSARFRLDAPVPLVQGAAPQTRSSSRPAGLRTSRDALCRSDPAAPRDHGSYANRGTCNFASCPALKCRSPRADERDSMPRCRPETPAGM